MLSSTRPHCIFYTTPVEPISYTLAMVQSPQGAWISSGAILGFGTHCPDPKSKGKDENKIKQNWGFPGGAVVENLPANAGDTGSSPGLGRSHMPRSN